MVMLNDSAVHRADELFAAGRRHLEEHDYEQAAECFRGYLRTEPVRDGRTERRSRAHCYIAVSSLARKSPLTATPDDVKGILRRHLANADGIPLAGVLAAIVKESYYERDGWLTPAELDGLADSGAVASLTDEDVALLLDHLRAMTGPTWSAVVRSAENLGLKRSPPPKVRRSQPVEERRRVGVPRYFAVIPPEPAVPPAARAWSLTALGGVMFALPCAGLAVHTPWYVGVALLALVLCAGTALLFFGLVTFRTCQDLRRRHRARQTALARARPQPSEDDMDRWLREDVELAIERAGEHHLLVTDPDEWDGRLVVEPQVIVGISKLPGRHVVQRVVKDDSSTSGFRFKVERVPLAKTRVGRDGQLRASLYRVLVVLLTEHRVAVFECDIDMATRRMVTEAAHSFQYDDIVTLSSRTVSETADEDDVANVLVDDRGTSRTLHGDNRYVISLVNAQQIEVSTAISKRIKAGEELQVAWDNTQMQRTIERMVWSRKEKIGR